MLRRCTHKPRAAPPAAAARPRPQRCTQKRRAAPAAHAAAGATAEDAGAAAAPAGGSDPSFAPLVAWLKSAGGAAAGIDLRPCRMGPATVRGLVATAPAAKGASLLSVPLSRALRDDRVAPAYPGAIWVASLAAYLIQEAAKGPASEWAPYIASLPGGHLLADPPASAGGGSDSGSSSSGGSDGDSSSSGGDSSGGDWPAGMLLLSEEEVAAVQYAPAVAALRAFQGQARAAYDAWRAEGGAAAAGCPWRRFALALHLVQSRSIRLAITGCRVMIPGIDCLNHGGSAGACGTLALGASSWDLEGERSVNFVTTRDVAAGEQVLWTYGDRSSEDFFVYHGFVLPGNPNEEVVLWGSVAELAAWFENQQDSNSNGGGGGGELAAAAAAAAQRAAQVAGIACSSPRVPGTCSWLMAPLALGRAAGGGGGGSGGGGTGSGSGDAVEAWLRALKLSSTAGAGGGSGSGGTSSGVERRLASLRLHLPEWGTEACEATPPELAAAADGRCDVRLAAALLSLCSAAGAAAGTAVATGGELAAAEAAASALIARRARQLLAALPTSADEDAALLASGAVTGPLWEVVAYRLAKKRVLQALAASQ